MIASADNSNQLFSESEIEEIKQRNDIVEVVSRYINLKKQGKDYMGLCPFHDDKTPSFSVSPTKQLYYCFGCSDGGNVFQFLMKLNKMNFQDAVLHLSGNGVAIPSQHRRPNKPQNKPKTTPIPSKEIELTILSGNIEIPKKVLQAHPAKPGKETWVTRYLYSDTQWVDRIECVDNSKPKGYDKITLPYHLNKNREVINTKGEKLWHPYRWNEVLDHGKGKWVLGVEGESCVEVARQIGLVSFTWQGGSWLPEVIERAFSEVKSAGIVGIVYFPDHDDAGRKKAEKVSEAATSVGLPCIILNPLEIWSEMPEKGDIVDCLNSGFEPSSLANKIIYIAQKSAERQNQQEFGGGSGGSGNGGDDGGNKVINHPAFEPLGKEQIISKIDELIEQNLSRSKLALEINDLAKHTHYQSKEIWDIYYKKLSESDLDNERSSNKYEVDNLLQISEQSLDLNDYLPHDLAEPLTQWCQWLNIQPQTVLTALLVGVSSLHKVGTELVIHRAQGFRVPSTIFAALVSESGQKKSPIFSNIIRKPLKVLQREKLDAHNAAMEDYKAVLKAWQGSGGEGEEPQKPKPPSLYYFNNATGEAIPVEASQHPEKTLFGLIDELVGYFNSSNAYRNGRGSDKQDLLSYFDGTGQTVLRVKEDRRIDVEKIYLSMFGTIQPAILKQLMADCSDPDGSYARFLLTNQPLAPATLADDDGHSVEIHERIADYYRRVDHLPEMEYKLSHQAFKRYQPVYNQLELLRVTDPNPGMRAVYSKMEGYIGRLGINLHVLWELASGKACPDEEIPLFIMEMAIALAKFYIGQVRLIHTTCDEESLPSHITRLITYSKRLEVGGDKSGGWIKGSAFAKTFTVSGKKKRPSSEQARQMFLEAVAMGYGRTRGSGNKLEYHWRCDNHDKDNARGNSVIDGGGGWQNGDTYHHAESLENTSLQTNMVIDDDTYPSSSTPESLQSETFSPPADTPIEGGVDQVSPCNGCDVDAVSNIDVVIPITILPPTHHQPSPSCGNDHSNADNYVTTEAVNLQDAAEDHPWTDECTFGLASLLESCTKKRDLAILREDSAFTPEELNKASKLLTGEKHQQIKNWVAELNAEKTQPKTAPIVVVTRIKYQSDYTGIVDGKNSQGDYFACWDKSSEWLAAKQSFQLPATLKIDEFEVMNK